MVVYILSLPHMYKKLTSFNYDVFIDDTQVRSNQPGIFAQTVKDYISGYQIKEFAVKDKVSKVRVVVKAEDKTAEAVYYVRFIKSILIISMIHLICIITVSLIWLQENFNQRPYEFHTAILYTSLNQR